MSRKGVEVIHEVCSALNLRKCEEKEASINEQELENNDRLLSWAETIYLNVFLPGLLMAIHCH